MEKSIPPIAVLAFILSCVTAYHQFHESHEVYVQIVSLDCGGPESFEDGCRISFIALNTGDFTEVLIGIIPAIHESWGLNPTYSNRPSFERVDGLPAVLKPGAVVSFSATLSLFSREDSVVRYSLAVEALGIDVPLPVNPSVIRYSPDGFPGRFKIVNGGNWEIFSGRSRVSNPKSLAQGMPIYSNRERAIAAFRRNWWLTILFWYFPIFYAWRSRREVSIGSGDLSRKGD
jgi:hypothetical protein